MTVWIIIAVLIGFLLLARLDVRGPSNLPVHAWNVFFGPKPKDGETQAAYSLRKAIAALAATAILALPLFFVSAIPDEGADFSGNESVVDLAILIIFAPLTAMALLTAIGSLLATLVCAVFRRRHVFDPESGTFVHRRDATVVR